MFFSTFKIPLWLHLKTDTEDLVFCFFSAYTGKLRLVFTGTATALAEKLAL